MDFCLNDSLGFLLYVADLKMRSLLQRKIKAYGITPEQWSILNQLYQQDGLNQKHLAEKTFKDQASLTRILDRLVKRELVKREDSPSDRRAFLIFITNKGRQLRDEIVPLDLEVLKDSEKALTKEEAIILKDLLRKFSSSIK